MTSLSWPADDMRRSFECSRSPVLQWKCPSFYRPATKIRRTRMLSPADATLVRRDVAVPGLARLLDPDALRQTVQSVASHLDIANLNYVRYKPGTSCLIGFDLVHKGERIP